MTKVRILIEMDEDRNVASAAAFGMSETGEAEKAMRRSKTVSAAAELPGVTLDTAFGVTAMAELQWGGTATGFAAGPDEAADAGAGEAESFDMQPSIATCYLMRAEVEQAKAEQVAEQLLKQPGVRGVFADVAIQPQLICPGSPPLGDDRDVERLLCTPALQRAGANGAGVLVAIVDTGINLAHLNARGKTPGFDAARSWVPRAGLTPGNLPVGHGTMCAYDVCIAAPRCTLLDIALLQTQATGGTVMEGFLSDAVRAYNHLIGIMRAPHRPGESRSLVVNNSWGMFHPSWDYPVGHPGNYSDNPNHPFNRIVTTLAEHGADILFAAGNCGSDCPDGRCQGVTANAIYGANSHPRVTCVAGVDTSRTRVGYSSKGPGRLVRAKPDISGYTHFRGSGVYAADGGTSAACPVVAGVFAAIRSKRPYVPGNPTRTPDAIRALVTSSAHDLGTSGFDFLHGHGVVDGCAIAVRLRPPVIDICRLRPSLCRPVPIPPDICRRYPDLCRPMPIPPRPVPLPPGPLPRQDVMPGQGDWATDGWGMLDLSDGEALAQLDMAELAELFYLLGQQHALEGAPPASPGAARRESAKGGCGCSG